MEPTLEPGDGFVTDPLFCLSYTADGDLFTLKYVPARATDFVTAVTVYSDGGSTV